MASEPVVRGAILQELWVAARAGWDFAAAALRAGGVDPEEYSFLSFVGTLQPVTRTVLSKATGLRRTTVRDVVGRLMERGHVVEQPNPHDGRSTWLVLTPAGQEIFDRGLPLFHEVLAALDGALDGTLREHEDAVRRVRLALQELGARAPRGA